MAAKFWPNSGSRPQMRQACIDTISPARRHSWGVWWGTLGVLGFSATLPATRLAVTELDGTVVGLGRALVAAAVAALVLAITGQRLPSRRFWPRLALTALGVVVGFPLFSAWALTMVPAAHGAVIVGLLPAATAVMAVWRGGERPSGAFWVA